MRMRDALGFKGISDEKELRIRMTSSPYLGSVIL